MIKQSGRQVRLKTVLPNDHLTVKSVSISDEISSPFEMHLLMYSDDPEISFEDMLGHNLTVALDRPRGGERFFNAYVSRFGFAGSEGRRYLYRAVGVPWIWFLTQTENCRIFHRQAAIDIVKQIFDDHGFMDYRDETSGSHPEYEYCVQYRESDFNFVSRLLEREGIFYYFVHENGRHTLVLADDVAALDSENGYSKINLFARDDFSQRRREGIFAWRPTGQIKPTRFVTTDYDFTKPRTDLMAEATLARNHAASDLEVYRYPGVYTERGDGQTYAEARIGELQSSHEVCTGDGNTRGLRSGTVFTLNDHPVVAFNRRYLVVSVTHEITSERTESGGGENETYQCTFAAVPDSAPYRPAFRAHKPLISGPQTAIVVNDTEGEEIEPDEFGRVKVSFPWEREGTSSCWVRVSQGWAGADWGAMSIPRAGQEVVVEFIDGDPDRPLITGRVYNAKSMPPYDPKTHRTVTTFKTNSSKGGGGFNELRFDDKKGKENVFVHAQKDFDLRTRNVRREAVGVEVHTEIGKKEFREVGEEQHETVGHHLYLKVGQDVHRDAGMNVYEAAGMDYVLNAGMSAHIKAGTTAVIEASAGLTLKVGGSFITLNPGGVSISGPMVKINSGGSALSGPGTKPEEPEPPKKAKAAEPGEISPADRARSQQPTQDALDSHPVSAALLSAASSGAPFCAMCDRQAQAATEPSPPAPAKTSSIVAPPVSLSDTKTGQNSLRWSAPKSETDWEIEGSVEAKKGYADKDVKGSAEISAGITRSVETHLGRLGDDDDNITFGKAAAEGTLGVSYDDEGEFKAGAFGAAELTAVSAEGDISVLNNLVEADASLKALSVGASGGIGIVKSDDFTGAKAEIGAEAIAIEGKVGGRVNITPKTIYDNTIGWATGTSAPEWSDHGIVVGGEGTAGIGAAAKAEGSAGKSGDAWGITGEAKAGAGPMAGLKVFLGVK